MILWVNGAYGAGKTSVCRALQAKLHRSHLFDPEDVGDVIRRILPVVLWNDYFLDYALCRCTTAALLQAAAEAYCGVILVPMTVVRGDYQRELLDPLRRAGISVCPVTLLASRETVLARLLGRGEQPDAWCIKQIDQCVERLSSEIEGYPIDTEGKRLSEVAEEIWKRFLSTEEKHV